MGFLRNRIVGITLAGAVALGSAGTGRQKKEAEKFQQSEQKVNNNFVNIAVIFS